MGRKAKVTQGSKRGQGGNLILNSNGVKIEADWNSSGAKARRKLGGTKTRIFTKK